MSTEKRILLVGLPFVLVAFLVAPADALILTLRVEDANSGNPAAARIQILDESGPLFSEENLTLRTHIDFGGHPYFYVEDTVLLDLPAGDYRVRAYAGPTSIPREYLIDLDQDEEQLVEISHWIDPREWGWYGADPHVHLQHSNDPNGEPDYLVSTPVDAGRAGRAEGLDVLYLLENIAATPRGLVIPNEVGIAVSWGEEFRSGFWGHLVVLHSENLVTVNGNPWANGPGLPAWPLLRKVLQDNTPPLAYMAHPVTSSSAPYLAVWPSTGYARELAALVDVPQLHGVAVGSGSNGPDGAWNAAVLHEGLAGGANWAAFGETDAVLGRFHMRPPGSPRTYARLTKSPLPGSVGLEREWRNAAKDRHSYASDGPILLEFGLGGADMGETASLPDEHASLELHLVSWTPLRRVTLWGSSGLSIEIPIDGASVNDLQLSLELVIQNDERIFLEAVAEGGTWYAQEESLRLVSSPIEIVRGQSTPPPEEWARRHADELVQVWLDSVHYRGYESGNDSLAALGILEEAEAIWEGLVDDAPGAFGLAWPPDGLEIGSTGLRLSWFAARSFDGEEIRYDLELDDAPDFAQAQVHAALSDTSFFIQDPLSEGQHWWRVRAYEPDGDSTWMADGAPSFTVGVGAVDAPFPRTTLLRLSPPQAVSGGVRAFLELSRDARVRWTWYDVRGRMLHRSEREAMNAGRHELYWDARDRHGRGVASGAYWLVADAEGRRSVRSVVLIEP